MRALLAAAGVWLLLAAFALVTLWPALPRSSAGWVVLIAVGPPLYLLGEALAAAASPVFRSASEVLGGRRKRWVRMALAIAFGAVFVAVLTWLSGASASP